MGRAQGRDRLMLRRYSSRRARLGDFLPLQLEGARAYDRIAGYFSSSILEVAAEAIEKLAGSARLVCNSQLDPLDVATARAAQLGMRREWCTSLPDDLPPRLQARLRKLYELLTTGKLKVKVLPDARFGLIHGKAGVITRADGGKAAFLGSVNESRRAFTQNYELLWVDESPEGVRWVQEEFDALWHSTDAVWLADAVIEDIGRVARRTVIPTVEDWARAEPDPAAPIVELPVYRRENGLWAHQKSFVKLAFDAHRAGGARYVLADQVGLGKTVQLGLAAKLMALVGSKPILILAPKPLLQQWQDELWSLLQFPVAVWNGRQWIDENGIAYPDEGIDGLCKCPRRAGIVSTGLIKRHSEASNILRAMHWECVILDEAHHARRMNLGPAHRGEAPEPTNLLRFMQKIAHRTRSLLLATATPVQLDPIEAWDLLDVLTRGADAVMGDVFSEWRRKPVEAIDYVLGREVPPTADVEVWEWLRNPLPPGSEGIDFETLRRNLYLSDNEFSIPGDRFGQLKPSDIGRIQKLRQPLFSCHHPFIRHIVRRTRAFLENTLDPQSNEPYLKRVAVRLHGEGGDEAIILPAFLERAYGYAEEFCREVAHRPGFNSGFLKTMLLRRVGSTIEAGRLTALKMLATEEQGDDEEGDESDTALGLYPLTERERESLKRFAAALEQSVDEDPKLAEVRRTLAGGWLDLGCIVFTQYYDSARWLAIKLSEDLVEERIGIYASVTRSGVVLGGHFTPLKRDEVKRQVQNGGIRLVVGTDAASEGLNLQCLGTLINLDLPWNPTRLEQRKGRIQRIGQVRDLVDIYNMRYRGSVEDRVHELLAERLENIYDMFGQVPDTLEDVWVDVALGEITAAKQVIARLPRTHPFEMRYDRIEQVDWENCSRVLDASPQVERLRSGW